MDNINLFGEAVFVDDIPSPENCLHGAFVYSKKALALIKKVDVKDALESPSVVSYISYSDIPKQGKNISLDGFYGEEILFAEDTVECFGQPIGLMVANTWHDAKRAADKVSVDYDCETLGPPILSVEDAEAKTSFYQVPQIVAPKLVGDCAKGMSEADIKIESAEVRTGSQYYFFLETQTALAIPDEDECMVVYSACQNPDIAQKTIAKCLGIPIHNVRVITRRVGGAFGGKGFRSVPAYEFTIFAVLQRVSFQVILPMLAKPYTLHGVAMDRINEMLKLVRCDSVRRRATDEFPVNSF